MFEKVKSSHDFVIRDLRITSVEFAFSSLQKKISVNYKKIKIKLNIKNEIIIK